MTTKIAEIDYTNHAGEFLEYLAEKIKSGEVTVIEGKSRANSDAPEYVTHTVIVKIDKD